VRRRRRNCTLGAQHQVARVATERNRGVRALLARLAHQVPRLRPVYRLLGRTVAPRAARRGAPVRANATTTFRVRVLVVACARRAARALLAAATRRTARCTRRAVRAVAAALALRVRPRGCVLLGLPVLAVAGREHPAVARADLGPAARVARIALVARLALPELRCGSAALLARHDRAEFRTQRLPGDARPLSANSRCKLVLARCLLLYISA